ncbi:hypothetical protein [Pleomorphomonas oryzae]|uniref:hypothetical protein n=1 Tax=Pleomorphomonas oryzae TaxID=261934 RepID=UPI0012EB9895|nr:hypothetical protein [Pleomorphomonas oryzae]
MAWWWSLVVALVEVFFLFGVGIYLSADPKYSALSAIWMIVSVVLVVHRQFLVFEFRNEMKETKKNLENTFNVLVSPIKKASEIVDLSASSEIGSVGIILSEYLRLKEERLSPERTRIIESAIASLKLLNSSMKTPTLEEPDFYRWLYREFDDAAPGSRIQIVSMDEPVEWNNTIQEQTYFEKNKAAAKRGVMVERVFFFSAERLKEARKNKFILAHAEANTTRLIGRRVDRESFIKSAPTAVKDAGQGFVLINSKFAIVDVFSPDGQVRGYVTFDQSEVQKYKETFQKFYGLSAPLVFDENI